MNSTAKLKIYYMRDGISKTTTSTTTATATIEIALKWLEIKEEKKNIEMSVQYFKSDAVHRIVPWNNNACHNVSDLLFNVDLMCLELHIFNFLSALYDGDICKVLWWSKNSLLHNEEFVQRSLPHTIRLLKFVPLYQPPCMNDSNKVCRMTIQPTVRFLATFVISAVLLMALK